MNLPRRKPEPPTPNYFRISDAFYQMMVDQIKSMQCEGDLTCRNLVRVAVISGERTLNFFCEDCAVQEVF